MAVNGHELSQAQVTLIFEAGGTRPLGWASVDIGGATYIAVPGIGMGGIGERMNVVGHEYQPNWAFPLDPPRSHRNPGDVGGTHGVHYYGTGSV
jgi:hypothetical protein